jgi:hypothetical protein
MVIHPNILLKLLKKAEIEEQNAKRNSHAAYLHSQDEAPRK